MGIWLAHTDGKSWEIIANYIWTLEAGTCCRVYNIQTFVISVKSLPCNFKTFSLDIDEWVICCARTVSVKGCRHVKLHIYYHGKNKIINDLQFTMHFFYFGCIVSICDQFNLLGSTVQYMLGNSSCNLRYYFAFVATSLLRSIHHFIFPKRNSDGLKSGDQFGQEILTPSTSFKTGHSLIYASYPYVRGFAITLNYDVRTSVKLWRNRIQHF